MKAKLKDRQSGDIVRDAEGNLWVVAYDRSHYYLAYMYHVVFAYPNTFTNENGAKSLLPKDMVKPLTLLVRDGEPVA